MNHPAVEAYLASLSRHLRRRGVFDTGIATEAREHFIDAIESGLHRGLDIETAVDVAIDRFGPAEVVAGSAFEARYRTQYRILLGVAIFLGMSIAHVDSRPAWDDSGITAFSMALGAAVLGFAAPYRPWVWALAIGSWVALPQVLHGPTPQSIAGCLLILAFPLVGAYAGSFCRRAAHVEVSPEDG